MQLFSAARLALLVLTFVAVLGCDNRLGGDSEADAHGFTAPTQHTIKVNNRVAQQLELENISDFEDAKKGLIASPESLVVKNHAGEVVWNHDAYRFVEADVTPNSVNPSLWRQAKLNHQAGLYRVTERVYQVRSFDLANLTIIEGDTGWIVVDPLTSTETARAALTFARQHITPKPIVAIIFTHSHVDHFGGVQAALDLAIDNPRIIAPVGFMEEATSENVMAGVPMQRRAGFMYGKQLPRSVRGHVDTGLGKEPPFAGQISIAEPTEIITETGQTLTIDGLEFVFQNAPHSEAPAELTFYLPAFKAYCGGEVVSRNMHNLYTLRGAKVRDALLWSRYIEEARLKFSEAEVYFGTHHWPLWGQERIQAFMKGQRDMYKYLHDQTMRMASWGATPNEIADQIAMPESMQQRFYSRGYYGTPQHNAKAVYQNYFGWYDGNPANLFPLPEVDAAKRYVDYMGGADAILEKAQSDFDNGDYRWVAQVLNRLVFAQPDNTAAKQLLAASYDQLGYQAESGPWRDVYLSAAYELRHGSTQQGVDLKNAIGLMRAIPREKFFASMAARLNPDKAEGKNNKVVFHFTDLNESYTLWLEDSVLHHKQGADSDADATLSVTHELFLKMAINEAGLKETLFSDDMDISGSRLKLLGLLSAIEKPDGKFAIVTPD